MALITSRIVAPDSSHWANWIDGTLSSDRTQRDAARGLHNRLLEQGKIPFLSLHHVEELLGVKSEEHARKRIACLQSFPRIAWLQRPKRPDGLGAITDILAAEAVAGVEGCSTASAVRVHVRNRLMRTGPAADATGVETWPWTALRPHILTRRQHTGMIAALSGLESFDDSLTLGEVASMQMRSPVNVRRSIEKIRALAEREAKGADPKRGHAEARAMADAFISLTQPRMPMPGMSVREFIVSLYVENGLDSSEIRDECRLSELSRLVTFRSQLRAIAENTNVSFERLRQVNMDQLPSLRIVQALREHGQQRIARPGSNVTDEHLAVLAAYCDILYVDKRTLEDFRRARMKEPELNSLIGEVTKAALYTDLAA